MTADVIVDIRRVDFTGTVSTVLLLPCMLVWSGSMPALVHVLFATQTVLKFARMTSMHDGDTIAALSAPCPDSICGVLQASSTHWERSLLLTVSIIA